MWNPFRKNARSYVEIAKPIETPGVKKELLNIIEQEVSSFKAAKAALETIRQFTGNTVDATYHIDKLKDYLQTYHYARLGKAYKRFSR